MGGRGRTQYTCYTTGGAGAEQLVIFLRVCLAKDLVVDSERKDQRIVLAVKILHYPLRISLEEAYHGGTRTLQLQRAPRNKSTRTNGEKRER